MQETDGEKIGQLVGYLQGGEPVAWDEVEECVSGFPGWRRMTQMMRYLSSNPNMRMISMGSPAQYDLLTADKRAHLLEIFRPYALLLDPARTPAERALALHQANYDTIAFCKENRANGSYEIANAARATLEACRAEKDLLRGSVRPEVPAAEMLRPAPTGTHSADALLHPSEAPPAIEPKPGLFARITSKLTGKKE